jgi:hypothetical protein
VLGSGAGSIGINPTIVIPSTPFAFVTLFWTLALNRRSWLTRK